MSCIAITSFIRTDGQTDGRTDGRTDGQTDGAGHDNTLRAYRAEGKKIACQYCQQHQESLREEHVALIMFALVFLVTTLPINDHLLPQENKIFKL